MGVSALIVGERTPVRRATNTGSKEQGMSDRIVESIEYAYEYITDRYSSPNEKASERRDELARMMGKETVEHLQRLAVAEARSGIAAARQADARGTIWAKHVWDLVDGAVRACVELGTPNLLDTLNGGSR